MLTVLVTWFIARRIGVGFDEFATLDASRWRPAAGLLAASCAVLLGGQLFSGVLWGRVVRDLGGTSLSYRDAVRVFLVANLGRYVPGKVWQVTGLAVLARRRGVSAALSSFAAVVAHGVSLVGATLVGAFVFVRWSSAAGGGWWIWVPVGLLVLTAIGLVPPVFLRLRSLLARIRLGVDWEAVRPGMVVRWLALFVAHWTIYGASFFLLARSFGLPGGPIQVGASYVAAYVVGYVAIFAPAGLGVREASLTGFLAPLMGEGPAAGLAIVARVWNTVIEVAPAAVLWVVEVLLREPGMPPPDPDA